MLELHIFLAIDKSVSAEKIHNGVLASHLNIKMCQIEWNSELP